MNVFNSAGRYTAIVAAAAMLCATGAVAETVRSHCISMGPAASEPLGDREGHALSVRASVCRVEGGAMDGGVATQQNIWEVDKGVWTLLAAETVTRVPGGLTVYRGSAGSLTIRMQDGRPAGWTANGRGQFVLGVGRGAALAGKSVSWTAQATGAATYVVDVTIE